MGKNKRTRKARYWFDSRPIIITDKSEDVMSHIDSRSYFDFSWAFNVYCTLNILVLRCCSVLYIQRCIATVEFWGAFPSFWEFDQQVFGCLVAM